MMNSRICECIAFLRKCKAEQIKVAMIVVDGFCLSNARIASSVRNIYCIFCVSYSAVTSGAMEFKRNPRATKWKYSIRVNLIWRR